MPSPIPSEEYDIEEMSANLASDLGLGLENREGEGSPPVDDPKGQKEPPQDSPSSPSPVPKLGADGKPLIDPAALVTPDVPPLPKSLAKENEALWKQMSPEARNLFLKRDADISRGIQSYQQGFQSWDTLTKPFAPLLQQHPDVNPVQLFQNLMQNHLTLLMGSPEEKKATALRLVQEYGIQLDGVPAPQTAQLPPEVLQRIQGLEQNFQAQTLAQQQTLVDAFFNDPKNEYAEEVAPDIIRLVQSGQATDLQSAYEQALWLNPAVREKLIAKQLSAREAAALEAKSKSRRVNQLNVSSSGEAKDVAPQIGSMDDTINGVIAKHYPTH